MWPQSAKLLESPRRRHNELDRSAQKRRTPDRPKSGAKDIRIPNASRISHTLRAKSTLRRYARLGYRHFVGLLPLFHCLAVAGSVSICSDTIPNTDGFVGSVPTGRFYDRLQQA
jgi:hypothetical protein